MQDNGSNENNNQTRKALDLFDRALAHPAPNREAFLVEQAGDDADLLARVLTLLRADEKGASVLQTGKVSVHDEPEDAMPERIGPYKITDVIGRGGMGTVYCGQRDSGDFEHQVAIKLIRANATSANLIERFNYERQLLANLSHPNIAQLFDGGEWQNQPYIVMEYVNGMPVTHWVAKHSLVIEDCLPLFLQVCEAVQYAHQNLIVHRDITPSNVLVNQSGMIKLIDFGIAKPFDSQADEADNSVGSAASLSFTPGFAAPERRQGRAVTTLSDVYSLGKLLAAMCEGQAMASELQAIVAKASQDKPELRFATVQDLIEDIRRFQHGFAVKAYSNGQGYRIGKFVRRHITAVAFTALGSTAIITALIVSLYQYNRAEVNLRESVARFNQVRELANYQLFDLYDQLSMVAGNTQIRADVAAKAQDYLENLRLSENAPDNLKLDVAKGYVRLARIFGVPAQPNLGDVTNARKSLKNATILIEQLSQQSSISPVELHLVEAQKLAAQGMILVHDDSDLEQAKQVTEQAKEILASIDLSQRNEDWYLARRHLYYTELERADQAGDTASLKNLVADMAATIDQWPQPLQDSHFVAQDRGVSDYYLGLADYIDGLFQPAMDAFETGNKQLQAVRENRPNDPMVLYQLAWNNYLGYGAAANLDQTERAIVFLDRAVESTQQLASVQEGDASIIRLGMQMREAKSQLVAAQGDLQQAIALQTALVADQAAQAKSKPEPAQFETWAFSNIILAFMYRDAEQIDAACKALQEAKQILSPYQKTGQLAGYMMNAANQLDERIRLCLAGEPLGSQNALFDDPE